MTTILTSKPISILVASTLIWPSVELWLPFSDRLPSTNSSSPNGQQLGKRWGFCGTPTVSVSQSRQRKLKSRVQLALRAKKATKTSLLQVLGSLRHVSCCFRPARSFFQRLQTATNSVPRFGNHRLDGSALSDLTWFATVLQHADRFNSIPIATFADLAEPSIHVYMDASNDGLCVLEPQLHRYIRQKFSTEEVFNLSINIRELRSAVLAALIWVQFGLPHRKTFQPMSASTSTTRLQWHG